LVFGYDRRLFLLPLGAGDGPEVGDVDTSDAPPTPAHLEVLLDALVGAVSAAGIEVADAAVVVGDGWPAEVVDAVRTRGLRLVVPADDRREERFVFAHGDGFGRHIEEVGPDLSSVRVRWHPEDEPEVKKEQALGLTKLAAWLHETDRRLLIELEVAPPTEGADDVDRTPEVVREIRDLGVEADVWSVASPLDPGSATGLAEVVTDEGRDRVGLVVRTGDGTAPTGAVEALAGIGAYRGVELGPEVWSGPLAALAAGDVDPDQAARTIGDRLARIIERSAAPGPS
jgi:hypothetical protein